MRTKMSLKNKRDLLLTTLLFAILGGFFILFKLFAFQGESAAAYIYYGTESNPIVSIDFVNETVSKNYSQQVPTDYTDSYPIIDIANRTVTLLGDYELNGIRQIVVIEYNFGSKSVQIIQEQSPNHICSREGISTSFPLICLPNRIRVEFDSAEIDFTV